MRKDPFQVVGGSTTAPAFTFVGDTNTGMWSPGADTLAFSTAGTEDMRITSTGLVGIGTSSPSSRLQVNSSVAGYYSGNVANSAIVVYGPVATSPTTAGTGNFDSTMVLNVTSPYALNQGASILLGGRSNDYGGGNFHMGFARIAGVQIPDNAGYNGDFTVETHMSGVMYERMRIKYNGYVGIGTSSPTQPLSVAGNIAVSTGGVLNFGSPVQNNVLTLWGGSLDPNTTNFFGFGVNQNTLRYQTNQSNERHAFYGSTTLFGNISSTGFQSAALGSVTAPAFSWTSDTNTGMWSPAADTLAFSTNGTEDMRIDSSGRVGIGTTAPSHALSVVGNISATGIITASASDERLKTNYQSIVQGSPLEALQSLRGIKFTWREDGPQPMRGTDVGLLAQDVARVLPEAVAPAPFDSGYMTIKNHHQLTALLVESVKELTARVTVLENLLRAHQAASPVPEPL